MFIQVSHRAPWASGFISWEILEKDTSIGFFSHRWTKLRSFYITDTLTPLPPLPTLKILDLPWYKMEQLTIMSKTNNLCLLTVHHLKMIFYKIHRIMKFFLQKKIENHLIDLQTSYEPSHEIMVLLVLSKLVLQTRICSHPMGLDV